MKKIRLEFPLCWGENTQAYLPTHIWLKVVDKHTEAFKDKCFTEAIFIKDKKISLEVEVPEELEIIEVIPPGGTTPVQDILMDWAMHVADPNWRVPGLKNVSIIFNNKIHEVKVINEKPDIDGWKDFINNNEHGMWLFCRPWALAVYSIENKVIAAFHWHSKLAGF